MEEKGFRTFSLEAGWSAGLRLNDHVLHGTGEPQQILAEELEPTPWYVQEYVDLVTWMRAHNKRDPDDPVQFMGNDVDFLNLGGAVFDPVSSYVAQHHPDRLDELTELYEPINPIENGFEYIQRPLKERTAERRRRPTCPGDHRRPGRPGRTGTRVGDPAGSRHRSDRHPHPDRIPQDPG
ncbi:erythromycin esterase family protein [Phytoactinopolyspora limicola]|uniref:erythromycin esterase family protein n=1 Tax=Phytoactinopolyspora limicola TaxID=2715536 RepID=UPI001A9C5CA3|nr:erythromycin esterase family protein [Phytoactinopolyspora limicola]